MNQKQVSEYVVGIYCRLSNDVSKKIKFTVRAKEKNGEVQETARHKTYMYNEVKEELDKASFCKSSQGWGYILYQFLKSNVRDKYFLHFFASWFLALIF